MLNQQSLTRQSSCIFTDTKMCLPPVSVKKKSCRTEMYIIIPSPLKEKKICLCVFRTSCSSNGKESACNAGDQGSIPVSGRSSGEGNGNPLQYPCLENPRERSLVGYCLWGHKELDMTE